MKDTVYQLDLCLPLLGAVSILSTDKKLMTFSERQLTQFKEARFYEIKIDNANYITIIANQFSNQIICDQVLSRKHKIDSGVLTFNTKKRSHTIIYEYYQFGDALTINARLVKDTFLQIKRLLGKEYGVLHTLFYRLVLYPIFSLYALLGYHILHGSALRGLGRETVDLLIGFDGVGKSSLTSKLIENKAYTLVSDNFIICNGKDVVPLIMPIRTMERIPKFELIYKAGGHFESLPKLQLDYDALNPKQLGEVSLLKIGVETVSYHYRTINLSALIQISNGADEISEANIFCAPFHFLSVAETICDDVFNVKILSIPFGKIEEAVEEFG